MKVVIIFILITVSTFAQNSIINTAHLDFLYENISVDNKDMGIIHIYSNYPYDKWTGDDDEGIACVDDAARAAIFYMKYYEYTTDSSALHKAKNLLSFVMHMQAENGFYYNFIWDDHSINKTFKTSVAEPNWWSWRAIWSLAEGYEFFKKRDSFFSQKLKSQLERSIPAALKWLPKEKKYSIYGGFELPVWLPYETAADQAAILVLGMVKYSSASGDSTYNSGISLLCDGLLMMQAGKDTSFPYNAFLSWQNTWHAWGNSQAPALISAGRLLNNKDFIDAGLKEVNNFYPFVIENNYLSNFIVERSADSVIIKNSSQFPQIAYGIRPMVIASLMAYDETRDEQYARTAGLLSQWFLGKNPAGKEMYSASTGRCFDGINDKDDINKNSGAESTIEALLALLQAEQNEISRSYFITGNED